MRRVGNRTCVGCVIALLLIGGVLAWCWWNGVWSYEDFEVYRAMRAECPPVWKDLNSGRVDAGMPLGEAIAMTKPAVVERFGDYTLLEYQQGLSFTGITVIAKGDRLVHAQAWSCTWDKVFFSTWTPQEERAYKDSFKAHVQAKWRARQ